MRLRVLNYGPGGRKQEQQQINERQERGVMMAYGIVEWPLKGAVKWTTRGAYDGLWGAFEYLSGMHTVQTNCSLS